MKPVIIRKSLRTQKYIAKNSAIEPSTYGIDTRKKLLLHQVFFWLKNPDSIEDRDNLVKGIKTLSAISSIQKLHVGVPASTEKRDVVDSSWQVSELLFFSDTNGQKIYQDHPLHHAFIDECSHLWSRVIVYDSINV